MIELINATKRYPGGNYGLFWESAVFPRGEIIGILGANGSGKTTLLKAIMGLVELQNGEVRVDGKPPAEQLARMAFIPEEGSGFPQMSPYEYARFLADFYGGFRMERFRELLTFFGLPMHDKIKTFSKGQRSKLEVCAGFSKGASYILMDEPFIGKDWFTRREFLRLMIDSLHEDETILISTHLIDEIEPVLDRAVILHHGRIKAMFTIDEMREAGENLSDRLASAAGMAAGSVGFP
jgi:ABC-2 type transport system ATP-binding protein